MTERYRGMNAAGTGTLTDEDHVWQSVNDILLTPVGSRLMRRNYGSLCPDLIDSPQNDVTRLQLMSAAVIALAAWEPRIVLDTINVTYSASGAVTATVRHADGNHGKKHPRGDIKGRQCQRLTSHSCRSRPLSKNSTSRPFSPR
jgi:phage baseplate assembly protein W